ncbi:MAG TPA: MOSC domain-containing protein [Candidatus Acidoferrales bacterium]|nr:MOSC domain-containing protein [Candidatus Acidoferrales bacterium]
MAEVAHLFRCLAHRLPMRPAEEIEAVANRGLSGCAHAQPGGLRQVLLMDLETLKALQLAPGDVKENITTRGFDVRSLRPGQHLRIGQALLEVTVPCEPCKRMEEIRAGLEKELRGRRGMLCRVLEGGRIRTGDPILALGYERVGA